MRWQCLGHAMWLVEAAGLRLLCDPLLESAHHGGIFDVVPRRSIDPRGLRADFVFVSHRHPDHFDVDSLHRLAQADRDTVVVTPDPLVVWTAQALGFRTVHHVPAGQRIELDAMVLITTPSVLADEWGLLVRTDDGAVWNQVDSVPTGPEALRDGMSTALHSVGETELALAIVRWQPLLEVSAQLGHGSRFPFAAYRELLDELGGLPTRAIVPSAAGTAHAPPHGWLNRCVYPLDSERFARDFAAMRPNVACFRPAIGDVLSVHKGQVEPVLGPRPDFVELAPAEDDPRVFEPLCVPPLVDVRPTTAHERETIAVWLADRLAPALPRPGEGEPLRYALQVVHTDRTEAWTFVVDGGRVDVRPEFDPQWDVLNQIAGSGLVDVLSGARHWGDLLLSGLLRASDRAYEVTGDGLRRRQVAPIFLYWALPYEEAFERMIRRRVAALT